MNMSAIFIITLIVIILITCNSELSLKQNVKVNLLSVSLCNALGNGPILLSIVWN